MQLYLLFFLNTIKLVNTCANPDCNKRITLRLLILLHKKRSKIYTILNSFGVIPVLLLKKLEKYA